MFTNESAVINAVQARAQISKSKIYQNELKNPEIDRNGVVIVRNCINYTIIRRFTA